MAIKESSNELNAPVVTARAPLPQPRPVRSLKDYLALSIATCGVGYLPLAPGTWGSLLAVGLFFPIRTGLDALLWKFPPGLGPMEERVAYTLTVLELIIVFCVAAVGVWAGSRVEKLSGTKDPGKVVIDEVAGQLVALFALPYNLSSWPYVILAFVLFRFFDIVKPYPARRFESLHGGLGIMADDIVAGLYAAIGVTIAVLVTWYI